MSDRSSGFFSSVGRFFTGGSTSAQKSPTKSSSNDIPPSSSSSPRSSNSNTSFLKDVMTLTTEVSPNKRSVKYLSPSALDSSFQKRNRTLNGLEIEVDPVADIFSSPSLNSQSRKRQLTEVDRSLISPSFRSESAKRKQDFGNRSLFEPAPKTGASRLDSTWCGQFSASHSPASSVTNFSLISRNTATTNGSSTLSSSTKHLLRKLESASTPARDVQRMTMIRAGYTRPEKWATSSVSSGGGVSDGAPPLKKSTDNCQSRIQLLSKTMSAHKHNYWRDLTRRRSDPKRNDSDVSIISTKTNGSAKSNELSSLFAVEKPSQYSRNSEVPAKKHQPVLKGSDGKSIGKNTFKFNEEDDLNSTVTETWLKTSEPLKLDAAPAKGFLGSLTFTFSTPVDVISSAASTTKKSEVVPEVVESEKSDADETDSVKSGASDNESESDSENSQSSSAESSEESDAQIENEKPKEKEDSRPQTSTDTISPAVSLLSSKNSSPKTNVVAPLPTAAPEKKTTTPAASSTWSCDGCFTSWPESTNECGCCGSKKGGAAANEAPAQKTLVSNIATFATTSKPSGVSFGFGAGSSSTATSTAPAVSFGTSSGSLFGSSSTGSSTAPAVSFGTSSTTGSLFGTSTSKPAVPNDPPAVVPTLPIAPAVPKPPATSSSASSDRVAWDCPDCMVSNKSTDDKCPCCGHIKYKSAGDSGNSNVFGDRAFKPSAPASGGFSFGIGSSTGTTPSFGLSAKPAEPVAAAPAAPAPTAAPLFGTSTIAPPAAPLANLAPSTLAPAPIDPPKTDSIPSTTTSSQPSLFGSTSGLSMFGTSKPADPKPLPTSFNPIPVSQTPLVSTTTTEVPKTVGNIFGNLSVPTSEPAKPGMFGAPTGNLFGSTIATPAVPEPPKPSIFGTSTTPSMFGAPSLPEAPKLNTFGSSSVEVPKFGAPSAAAPPLTFGIPAAPTQNAPAPAQNLFGSATTSLFGQQTSSNMFGSGKVGTDSTDGGPSAKRGNLFSAPADSTTKPFGTFGNSSTTSAAAPAPFGGAFGGNSFGSFGSQPSVAPTLSNSSSTSSLFNSAPVQSNESSMFSTTAVPNSFNFGSSTNSSNGVFMFGGNNAAPIPPPVPNSQPPAFAPFQSAAPIGGENAFAYQAPNGARKMAMARRRNPNRK
ncbi:unnamed protein product [Caenorhabditis angaria]|uniref:RanBP2-type domain-containing protein n=1 Tax=Caenorhabditis angaria TaxID=860376 RepID=A0A9P1MSR1_9PELO|nr:unnamed protein product [Caenorhabditis angaria]